MRGRSCSIFCSLRWLRHNASNKFETCAKVLLLSALALLLLLPSLPELQRFPSIPALNTQYLNPYSRTLKYVIGGYLPLTFAAAAAGPETDTRNSLKRGQPPPPDRPAAGPSLRKQQQQDSPLERQLKSLRQQLARTRAAITEIESHQSTTPAGSSRGSKDGAGSRGSGGGVHGDVSSLETRGRHAGQQQQQQQLLLLQELRVQEQQLRLDIAVALQQLNAMTPDGGSRLPEAEEHYRAVIVTLDERIQQLRPPASSSPVLTTRSGSGSGDADRSGDGGHLLDLLSTRVGLVGNLAALLLEAERPHLALAELEAALAESEDDLRGAAPGLLCGLRFNRGKALAAVGRTAEADEAYVATARAAVGLEPACFAKACAAMTRLPDELLPLVQSAVRLAEDSGLRRRRLAAAGAEEAPTAAAADRSTSSKTLKGTISSARTVTAAGAADLMAAGGDVFGDRAAGGWLAGIGVSELGWLYFALAKALDDRRAEAGEVWRVLEQANSLLSSQQSYDPAHDWRQLRTLTAVFRAPLLRAVAEAGVGVADESPVFVVGLPRSGSTLVETMLSRYPGVWAAGEDTALAPLTNHINDLLTTQGLSQPSALAEFGRRYLEEMRRRALMSGWDPNNPPVRIVDKMLRNLWLLGYIEMLLPRACIVHVVRHPLDVALSCYSQPFGYSGVPWSFRLDHIGEQVRMAATLTAHWAEQLPAGRILTLHYEEVVTAPEASARRLLAHCGLDWHPGVLQFYTANRTVATASVAQVRKPLYNSSVGRWRKYEEQMAELAEQIRPEILSYEANLAAALRAAEAETRRLQQEPQGPSAHKIPEQAEQQPQQHGSEDAMEATGPAGASTSTAARDEL